MPMSEPALNRATHFSIVWAVVLAVLTLVEWGSLERDPMSEQIFLPFIERQIEVSMTDANATAQPGISPARKSQTLVQIDFNGPLFLAWFFGPILIMQATGMLWAWLRRAR